MLPESEWETVRGNGSDLTATAGVGVLRVALLFGSAALAIAMLVTPLLSRIGEPEPMLWSGSAGIDYTETGSIGYRGSYTIRRSVLQGSAGSICVLRDNGTRSGDCN